MNLVIDAGNTATKAGIFERDKLIKTYYNISLDDILRLVNEYKPEGMIVSSVKMDTEEIQKMTGKTQVLILNSKSKIPFNNTYKTPETLGVDRLAAVAGAKALYPSEACLVIDAGTCLTYDFIDENNNYLGGSISPGINLRFKALNSFTSKLPLVERKDNVELSGLSTEEAIRSGVINGITEEVKGIIHLYKKHNPLLRTLICGGDAQFFETKIKEPIFVIPELVLIGLNRILEYNNA